MEESPQIITGRDVLIVIAFLILFMLVGSLWDYPISQALHNQSSFYGNFFAAFGELPAFAGVVFSGILLLLGRNREHQPTGTRQIIGGVMLFLIGSAVLTILPGHYLPFSPVIAALIGLVIIALVTFFTLRFCRAADRRTMLKVAAAIVAVVLLETLLINLIKIPWERPRMRLIAINPEAYFHPWWVIGGDLKERLTATGVAGEEFKSFPSAHTANGATAILLLSSLPLLVNSLRQKRRLLFFCGVVWGGMVALSRIIMGAHFVTDTAMGFCLTLLITLFIVRLTFKHKANP